MEQAIQKGWEYLKQNPSKELTVDGLKAILKGHNGLTEEDTIEVIKRAYMAGIGASR